MDNVHISTQVLNETTNLLAKKYSISWGDLVKLIDDFGKNIPVHLVMISEIRKACGIA
jgi:predicted nucleic acid-binding protein